MKLEGQIVVTFTDSGIDSITFPKKIDEFPNKREWKDYSLWQTQDGNDNKMKPLTNKAQENLDDICNEFAKRGYIGAKKAGRRKLASIRYVLQTSLDGYEFVKN